MYSMFLGQPHQSIVDWINGHQYVPPTPPGPSEKIFYDYVKIVKMYYQDNNQEIPLINNDTGVDLMNTVGFDFFGWETEPFDPEYTDKTVYPELNFPGFNCYGAAYQCISQDADFCKDGDQTILINSENNPALQNMLDVWINYGLEQSYDRNRTVCMVLHRPYEGEEN